MRTHIFNVSEAAGNPSGVRMPVMPPGLEPWVEAEEAAAFVHMSPRHLKKLAREGNVPGHPRGDGQRRRWLFLLSELDAWMRPRVNSSCYQRRGLESIQ